MDYLTDVGLEIHVQLDTESKIFCSCSVRFGDAPNANCCPVCSGTPGALPVLNRRAAELAVRTGLALGSAIPPVTSFDRKNYFYPDLPRGYQITQARRPICAGGSLDYDWAGQAHIARFRELHLEDDAGKLIHCPDGSVLADYNRCGVPLLELVTEPCFHSGGAAAAFLEELILTLRELEVSQCRMQEGSLRTDVNVSVHRPGETAAARTELKNLGSVRAVRLAVEQEALRQRALLEQGLPVRRETRRWDEKEGISLPMREKEEHSDYRYFPEPDLPELETAALVAAARRAGLPPLPRARRRRYAADYGLDEARCRTLTARRDLRDFFEACMARGLPAREAADWLCGEGMRVLGSRGGDLAETRLTPEKLGELLEAVERRALSLEGAKAVFQALFDFDGGVNDCAAALGLRGLAGEAETEAAVSAVLAECGEQVRQLRAGKTKVLGYLKGQVMRRLKGRGDPVRIDEVMGEFLEKIQ